MNMASSTSKHEALTEEQLFNFMRCPIRYDAIWNKHLITAKEDTTTALLRKETNHFLIQLMNGKVMSTESLKNRWDRACEGSPSMTPQRNLEGFDKLMRMYRWAADEQLVVGDINIPYTLPFWSDSLGGAFDFQGQIACIAMGAHAKKPCLLYLDYDNRLPDQAFIDMKLKYTLDAWAARKLTGKKLGTKIHHVKSGKDFFTMREIMDFQRMATVITNVMESIHLSLYYPRESVMCKQCDMLNFCRVWKEDKK